MTELPQELEKEKTTNQLLEDQVEKSFLGAESKAKVLEEEKKKTRGRNGPNRRRTQRREREAPGTIA